MTWIALTVLLGLVFWGGIIWWAVLKGNPNAGSVRNWGVMAAAAAAVLWVIVSVAMMVHTVGQREVAIVYNFSGTISGKKDAGVVTTMPWQHIRKENIGIQHDEWIFDESNAAVSIDQQKITAVISVNYQIDPAKVVDLYKRVGASWKSIIIDARVPQVFKETTATYTTPQLTQKREQLRIDTKERLTKELSPYDIQVVDVFVRNIGFSQSYTDAIERKQKQVQDALTAQAKVNQVEAEANQKVAAAEGEAKANVARARGEATANRLRSQSLTARIIQQQAIEKLNPNVQVIVCPPASVCIPNSGIIPSPAGSGG
jgi:regulator of protease activity HflC (stomatin/prohibitin superfamily)